jgi:CheY-like chemotaxis protein
MASEKLVLVVDDDPVARLLAANIVRSLGCVALEAGTAAEATRLLNERKPDLVILDGLLPDTDGLRWLRKQRSEGNAVRVLFSSAFWQDLGSHRTLTDELDVSAVLGKPMGPGVLARSITDALRPRPSVPPVAR